MMQIASLTCRWEVNEVHQKNWGYDTWRDMWIGDIETGVYIARESSTHQFEVAANVFPSNSFADIRDAEEYCENEFKKHLNRFLEHARPVLDIAAFARF